MDVLKDIPTNIIPPELWKAFALILIGLVGVLMKKNLDEMREERKEFRDQLLKLTINDAVQDERIEAIEEAGKIVKYRR
jgi:hypothetical protein